MSTVLAFVDTETTGLDPRIHQPYEVCIWREDRPQPQTLRLPHSLEAADPKALLIGGYHDRAFAPNQREEDVRVATLALLDLLGGVTLVGSNPAFDAAMLTRFIGVSVWHYRLINVAEGAMWAFGWDRPLGLADVRDELVDRGYDIPEPDHTAEGDVRTTRAIYYALRNEIGGTR